MRKYTNSVHEHRTRSRVVVALQVYSKIIYTYMYLCSAVVAIWEHCCQTPHLVRYFPSHFPLHSTENTWHDSHRTELPLPYQHDQTCCEKLLIDSCLWRIKQDYMCCCATVYILTIKCHRSKRQIIVMINFSFHTSVNSP